MASSLIGDPVRLNLRAGARGTPPRNPAAAPPAGRRTGSRRATSRSSEVALDLWS